jgi:hypothetical protein
MFPWLKQHRSTTEIDDMEAAIRAHDDNEDDDNADLYHFDHGSPLYYRTTDSPPHLSSDIVAQRTFDFATKFWAEIFGSINVIVVFFITFLLQLYR